MRHQQCTGCPELPNKKPVGWSLSPLTIQVVEMAEMLKAGFAINPDTRPLEVIEGWKAGREFQRAKESEAEAEQRRAEADRKYEAERKAKRRA